MLLPELGHQRFGVFIGKGLCVGQHGKRVLVNQPVIHEITALQCESDFQRGKAPERGAAAARGGGRDAVEAREGAGEAVRRIVAVFQRNVKHRLVRGRELDAGSCQAAAADVLAHRHAAEHGKALLEIERLHVHRPGDRVRGQLAREVVLDELYRFSDDRHPFHTRALLCPTA